jgi:hypothetical protein
MGRPNHVPSGHAVVTLTDAATGERTDELLGPYRSAKSRLQYGRGIAE